MEKYLFTDAMKVQIVNTFNWYFKKYFNRTEMITNTILNIELLLRVSTNNRGIGAITSLGHRGDPLPKLQQWEFHYKQVSLDQ